MPFRSPKSHFLAMSPTSMKDLRMTSLVWESERNYEQLRLSSGAHPGVSAELKTLKPYDYMAQSFFFPDFLPVTSSCWPSGGHRVGNRKRSQGLKWDCTTYSTSISTVLEAKDITNTFNVKAFGQVCAGRVPKPFVGSVQPWGPLALKQS